MVRVFRFALALVAVMLVGATVSAQFGHPLKGSWSGEWGASKTHVVLDMNWDGKNLTGTINPGASGIALTKATLDPATWMVHFEADGGKIVIDGKVENIGAFARFITGTWQQGGQKGNFKITRN